MSQTMESVVSPITEKKLIADFQYMESRMNGLRQSPVHEMKRQAVEAFEKLGIPTSRHEEWKYSPIWKFTDEEACFATVPAEEVKTIQAPAPLLAGNAQVVLSNGKLVSAPEIEGLRIKSLDKALESDEALINKLGSLAKDKDEALTALNTAFFENGLYIHVGKDFDPTQELELVQILSGANEKFLHQRIMIVTEANAELKINYRFVCPNEDSIPFLNSVEEAFLGPGSRLFQLLDQNVPNGFRMVNTRDVAQEKDSFFSHLSLAVSGKFMRNNVRTHYRGQGCDCDISGLYLVDNEDLIDHHLSVDHAVPNCTSNQLFKGIMKGKGHGVFNGKVFVREHAQQTNAYQSNKNLLLSDKAVIDTKPQLEIFADDVKCSHGATIGQLDDEPVFYLQSRGIPEEKARAMLTLAFAADVLEKIKDEELRIKWQELLEAKLGLSV